MHTIRTRVRVRDLDGVSPHESRSGPKLLRRWPPMMRIAAKAGILSLTAVPSREARERTPRGFVCAAVSDAKPMQHPSTQLGGGLERPPMRHLYAPTPGEFLVGDKLEGYGYAVYLPARDIGIDFLAERNGVFVRLQVKESRTYPNRNQVSQWHSWSQIKADTLLNANKLGVDRFVFVVHAPVSGQRLQFAPFYILISPAELDARLSRYRAGGDRAVYWHLDESRRLWEMRGKTTSRAGQSFKVQERDFTDCLEAWESLSAN
jgi:hypothetical protein